MENALRSLTKVVAEKLPLCNISLMARNKALGSSDLRGNEKLWLHLRKDLLTLDEVLADESYSVILVSQDTRIVRVIFPLPATGFTTTEGVVGGDYVEQAIVRAAGQLHSSFGDQISIFLAVFDHLVSDTIQEEVVVFQKVINNFTI